MSPLGLLSHLSPSTIGMLASPPKIPGVPTLAELQKRADEVAASLPTYADLSGGHAASKEVTGTESGSDGRAGSTATRGTPLLDSSNTTRAGVNSARTPSKPIPRVNLDPNAVARTTAVHPPGHQSLNANTDGGASGGSVGSWLPSWLGGSSEEALTIPPPPRYAVTDPHRRGAAAQGTAAEHDQGRSRLMKMQRGYGRLQGGIPGEDARGHGGYTDAQLGVDAVRDEKKSDGSGESEGWWWRWIICGAGSK